MSPPPGGSPQGAALPDHLIDLEQQNLSPDNKALAGKLVRLIQSNLDALERVAAETIPQVNLLSDPVAARVAAPGLLDRLSQGIQGVFVRKTPSVAELPAATTPETNPVTRRLSESFNRLIPPELLLTAGNRLNAVERQSLQARLLGGIQQLARDPQVRFALSAELAFAADGSVAEGAAQDDAQGGDIAPPSARENWIRSFLDKLNLNPAERSFMDKEIGSTLAAATKDFSTFTLGK